MSRKKADDKTPNKEKTISFKCTAELERDLKDLAYLSRSGVSSLLVELASEFVKANKQRIINFRRSSAKPIKLPTFATPPKTPAQIDTSDKAGEQNAEN